MSSDVAVWVIAALGAVLAGAAFYFFGRRVERRLAEEAARSAEQQSSRLIADVRRDAETAKAEAILAGKEEVMRSREDWEREKKGRREEIARIERRLEERETQLDRKITALEEREADLERRDQSLRDKEKHLEAKAQALTEESAAYQQRLEQLAGMSADEAKAQLLRAAEERARRGPPGPWLAIFGPSAGVSGASQNPKNEHPPSKSKTAAVAATRR